MRIVKITKDDVDQESRGNGEQISLTGTDEQTGDRVTFALDDGKLINTLLGLIQKDGSVALPLADSQVTDVEPTSGQWDSPGTSPEEEGA